MAKILYKNKFINIINYSVSATKNNSYVYSVGMEVDVVINVTPFDSFEIINDFLNTTNDNMLCVRNYKKDIWICTNQNEYIALYGCCLNSYSMEEYDTTLNFNIDYLEYGVKLPIKFLRKEKLMKILK